MKNKIYLWDDDKIHGNIVQEFCLDRPIITSTDTVLGFLAPITKKSFEQLNLFKNRSNKPYLILLADLDSIGNFCSRLPLQIENFLKKIWPGPITVLLPANANLKPYVTAGKKTVALRMPDHTQLRALAKEYNGLFSTSANSAGRPVPLSVSEIEPALLQQVNLVINNQQKQLPSTIVDLSGEKPVIVREGAVSKEEINKLFEDK